MKTLFVALLMVSLAAAGADTRCVKDQYGKVVCGKGECTADQYKNIFCAPQGGSAVKDRFGNVVCGVGQCAKDDLDQVWCSKEPGGGVAIDEYKKVKCLDGCELATAALCEVAK